MIILNKNVNSFHPLALQQHAPKLSFDDGSVSYTRRSDSFWCREQKKLGFDVEVCKQLFVYHDNRFDEVPTSSGIRKNIVQEICGGILCRGVVWRKKYKERRLLELRSWLYRVNGILQTLQNRSYCSKSMIRFLIIPLKEILDFDSWEAEVFSVIERTFGRLKDFVPNPADFKSLHIAPAIAQDDMRVIKEEWNTARVDHARGVLVTLVGMEDGVFVGLGSEGVCFRVKDLVYKVFDQVESLNDLPSTEAIKLLNASYVKCDNFPFILKRPYYSGTLFRGNSGPAMIKLLREWKGNYLYHTNLTPDNLILDDQEEMLTIVDIGKDVHISTSSECYACHFDDMCKRAFLCVQFGSYADNAHKLKKLKTWMRGDSTSPHLVGFENFKKLVNNPKEGDSQFKLMKYLEQKDAVCCAVVTATPRFFDRSTQVFLAYDDDTKTIDDINRAISGMILEGGHNRLAVVIDDPHSLEQGAIRPLWFYRRHIRRLQMHTRFTLEEDDVLVVDGNRFQEIAAFHVFLLTCSPMTTTPPLRHGCFLMIKSCPMEYHTILSDVRRIVHCLEPATSFKSIVLVSDIRY